ncbi:hypothetical protein [Segetibacter sp.]|jgi:hypothetical protein|uniref:hypothetical protein n=1 Tax=Segetibacter sp. TaxID=2231182 RepID=UPI002609ABDB|nr:hypothetical protein [Segetibacter sp.]
MKNLWLSLLALSLSISAYSQKEIKVEAAKDNVGDTVKICTKIFDTNYDESANRSPTYLYTSSHNPNATLTFVIWGEKRKFFDYKPEKDLKEREVCVTGKIELLKDKPVIVIEKQSQIDIK